MNTQAQHTLLSLVLDAWQQQGFQAGTDTLLRVQELVQRLPADMPPEQLRNMLAALLVHSPKEQEDFYTLFSECLEKTNLLCAAPKQEATLSDKEKEAEEKARNWGWIAIALGTAIVLGILALWYFYPPVETAEHPPRFIRTSVRAGDTLRAAMTVENDPARIHLVSPSDLQESQLGNLYFFDSTGMAIYIADAESSTDVVDTIHAHLAYSSRVDSVVLLVRILPQLNRAIKEENNSRSKEEESSNRPIREITKQDLKEDSIINPLPLPHEADISRLIIDPEDKARLAWWQRYEWPLKALLSLLLGLLAWAILRWQQYRQAKVVAELRRADKAPYIWNPTDKEREQAWLNETAQPLLNRFRGRTPDDRQRLDIPGTIDATSKQAGRVAFVYQQRTLPPNYLLLIDRFTARDHQAQLFDALYRQMLKAEVPVSRYFFNGDPRMCYSDAFPDGIALVELLHRHGNARLMIVGEGLGLLSPASGQPAPWTGLLRQWSNRALLSPKPHQKWGALERELEELLLVLPASPQGLAMAIEAFLAIETPSQAELLPQVKDAFQEPVTFGGPLMATLKQHFKTPMLDWIAACAVWPRLSWELTLHLGTVLGEHHQQALVTFDRLRELAQLPWFLQGEMPQRVRELLLDYLAERGLETKVRQALQQLLVGTPAPPKDSVAYEDYRMNIILNELSLQPDPARRRALEREFANYLAAGKKPDFVAFRLLDRAPTRLQISLSNRLKRFAYREGLPGLGWGLAPRVLLIWGILVAALLLIRPDLELCDGEKVVYKEQELCLASIDDRLLFLQTLARDAIETQDYEFVDSIRIEVDILKYRDVTFYVNTGIKYYNFSIKAFNCLKKNSANCSFDISQDSLVNLLCINFEKGYELLDFHFQNEQIELVLTMESFCNFENPIGYEKTVEILSPEMLYISGGTFMMGCSNGEQDKECYFDEKPAHEVNVLPFFLGKYEVTNAEFTSFLNAKGNQVKDWQKKYSFKNTQAQIIFQDTIFLVRKSFMDYPVSGVSWHEAKAYTSWLNERTGLNYRLPSEAEWEYAARGGSIGEKSAFLYSGSHDIEKVAWYGGNSGNQANSVGVKQANQLGLHDMSGNVWEWCEDIWHENYDGVPRGGTVWLNGRDSSRRVLRGGSWYIDDPWYFRVINRNGDFPAVQNIYTGFRLARD